ncbi:MAG: YitT family protein [Oscillospiraceae bacterium]|nr:YitT family protein [Oscillospiraceae bacterium]
MKILSKFKLNLKEFALLNLGILLISAGVYFFSFPNKFVDGGVSGLAIILGNIQNVVSTATIIVIINTLLLIAAFIILGRDFGFKTIYASFMYSAVTWVFEKLVPLKAPLTGETFMELLFSIGLPAIGSAILFYLNASSGGTDIIALILKKYSSLNTGTALLASDALIAFSSLYFFGIRTGMFSVLGLFMKSFIVNNVVESLNMCKYFTIVTEKEEEIRNYIIHELERGATCVDAVGAFTGSKKKMIMTACKRSEAVMLKRMIKKADPDAFMFITNTSEIIGNGFLGV